MLFARAASTFANLRGEYEQVIPQLERGYGLVRDCVNGSFDSAAVARAEHAWWVARRVPGQESPENVGRLIADKNAMIFNLPAERLLAASVLRARAGRLAMSAGNRQTGRPFQPCFTSPTASFTPPFTNPGLSGSARSATPSVWWRSVCNAGSMEEID